MKQGSKILFFLLLMSIGTIVLRAQESIPVTGGNASGTGGTVSYSVGQIACNVFSGSNGTIIQGVQQPYEISVVTAIENAGEIITESKVYPNPTDGRIKLIVESSGNENLRFCLYDISGVVLQEKKIENRETEIIIENNSSSVYLLKLIKNNKEIKVFKIVKR
jgi:hypothetical protein